MVRNIIYFLSSGDNYHWHFGDFFPVLFLTSFVCTVRARVHLLLLQCQDGIVNKVWIPVFLFNSILWVISYIIKLCLKT